jgi:hypothetical protein
MKKTAFFIIAPFIIMIFLFFIAYKASAESTNLDEYFDGDLPSIEYRGRVAQELNVVENFKDYTGTAVQNTALLESLQNAYGEYSNFVPQQTSDEELLGAVKPIRPSRYETTLSSELASEGTETTLTVNSLTLPDDTTIDDAVYGDFLILTVGEGDTEEKIAVSTLDEATRTFTIISRGLKYGEWASSTANMHLHLPGERVFVSNDDHFLYNQFVAIDSPTATGTERFLGTRYFDGLIHISSTTATKYKLFFGDNQTDYLWFDSTNNRMGFATSSNEFAFNQSGTTFDPYVPLTLSSGNLALSTSTDFTLNDGKLSLNVASSVTWTGTPTYTGTPVYSGGSIHTASTTMASTTIADLNATAFSINSDNLDATPTEIDRVIDGTTASVTAARLDTLTGGRNSNAAGLHQHTVTFGNFTRTNGEGTGHQVIPHGLNNYPIYFEFYATQITGGVTLSTSLGMATSTTNEFCHSTADHSGAAPIDQIITGQIICMEDNGNNDIGRATLNKITATTTELNWGTAVGADTDISWKAW